tara:strand:- start:2431 stop:2625 length:195 start_codon:yes stop_codon:yes gene_type:complete
MNKKTLIGVGILVLWALIIASYFIESTIYEELVLWIFVILAFAGVIYVIFSLYVWLKNLFNKKK